MAPEPWGMEPEALEAAAANVRQDPHAYLDLALKYVEESCQLNRLAFGLVGAVTVAGGYEASRSAIEQNLRDGITKLKEMAEGLEEAAGDARQADDDSVIRPPEWLEFDYQSPGGGGDWGRSGGQGGALAAGGGVVVTKIVASLLQAGMLKGALLQPINSAAAAMAGASSKLAPTAIAATVMWAMFTPLDPDIGQAVKGWEATATQLDQVNLNEALKPLEGCWNGEDCRAFERWANQYQSAVDNARDNASDNAKTLDDVVSTLETLQWTFFGIAAASLVMIIAYEALAKLPYVGPAFKALQQVQGLILSIIAGTTVTGAGSIVMMLNKGMPLFGVNFAELKVNAGGGTGFAGLEDMPQPGE